MTRISLLVAAAGMTAFAAPAFADCAADIASLRAKETTASTTPDGGQTTNFEAPAGSATAPNTGPISKDGSVAPLGSADSTATETTAGAGASDTAATAGGTTTTPGQGTASGEVSKDGSTAPMASAAGGTDPQIATSSQDAAAQQTGQSPAASAAETTAALEKAQTAADAGDEAACQAALKPIMG
jgi:hypothetical protein